MSFAPHSRRNFIKLGGTCVAAGLASPSLLSAHSHSAHQPGIPLYYDPGDLVTAAIDAALSYSVSYADARITHVFERTIDQRLNVSDDERITIGIRVLHRGAWGFASSAVQTRDEAIRLGTEAARQATSAKPIDDAPRILAPRTGPTGGHWTMPIRVDPFELPVAEVSDFLQSITMFTERKGNVRVLKNQCTFVTTVHTFASSDGHRHSQQTYLSYGDLTLAVDNKPARETTLGGVDSLSPAGVGWELYETIRDDVDRTIEDLKFDLSIPTQPVDVGRFDTVMDAWSVANLLNPTIGSATELDRMLGFEANASGTSYIGEPSEMLGTLSIGSPLLTVTANRSAVGGASTVQWDDEGVGPTPFTLVNKGVFNDVSTNRETVELIRPSYQHLTRPIQSNGCATAGSALYPPLTVAPNLELVPGTSADGFDTLISSISSGVAISSARASVDFQQLNGLGMGRAYLVRQGKRVARLTNAGVLFRSPELWKSLTAIGGTNSARRYGVSQTKGEPPQSIWRSVTAVPATFKELSVIDVLRKA